MRNIIEIETQDYLGQKNCICQISVSYFFDSFYFRIIIADFIANSQRDIV